MGGAKTGVATRISHMTHAIESHTHLKNWHDNALQLVIGDTI